MSNASRLAGSIISKTLASLSAGPHAEKFVFRRFKGYALAQAAMGGVFDTVNDIQTVVLNINPKNIGFDKKKIVNKVQTSAPGRFVVFDWGTDLTILNIDGNTGNLIPEEITSGLNPFKKTMDAVANIDITGARDIEGKAGSYGSNPAGIGGFVQSLAENAIMNNSSYMDLLKMSKKYNTFKKLQDMYDQSDADSDVITLEMGDMATYRGYFQDFSFDIDSEKPWNWAYKISFIILANLSEPVTRWDSQYATNNPNLEK